MAKIDNLFDAGSGSIANVTIAKTRFGSVAKKKITKKTAPSSPAQIAQQNRHATAVRYMQQVLPVLRSTLDKGPNNIYAANWFMKLNVSLMDDATKKVATANINKLQFAKGRLEGLKGVSAATAIGGVLNVSYDTAGYSPGTSADDVICVYVYNQTQDVMYASVTTNKRSDGNHSTSGFGATGDTVHVFASALDQTKLISSDTAYSGSYTLQ